MSAGVFYTLKMYFVSKPKHYFTNGKLMGHVKLYHRIPAYIKLVKCHISLINNKGC